MSVHLTAAAWAYRGISPTDKLVLVRVAFYAADDGSRIFPSVRALADDTGLAERTVQSALRRLESAGLIRCVGNQTGGKPGSTRQYVLDAGLLCAGTGAADAPVGVQHMRGRVQQVHRTGAAGAPKRSLKDKETHSLSSASLRRESAPRTRRARLEAIPNGWQPDEQLVEWAIGYAHEKGEVLGAQEVLDSAARFVDWHAARGTRLADASAAFRLWWHGDIERAQAKRRPQQRPGSGAKADGLQAALDRMRRNGQHLKADLTERFAAKFSTQSGDVFDVEPNEQITRGKPT